MFMPLLVLSICTFMVFLINKTNSKQQKFSLILFLIIIPIFIDFLIKSITFAKIVYPRDILLSYGINKWVDTSLVSEDSNKSNFVFEIDNVAYRPEGHLLAQKYKNFLFVNFAYFHPISASKYEKVDHEGLIFISPHFQSYYIYSYEGLNYQEREFLQKIRLQLKIFLLNR
jgi:hypothetical protein